jgi:hypothetical protein
VPAWMDYCDWVASGFCDGVDLVGVGVGPGSLKTCHSVSLIFGGWNGGIPY